MNNLQVRMVDFADQVMTLCSQVSKWSEYSKIIEQVSKSSSSIGANYSEAQSASSRKDFHNKIRIGLKEARETEFWLLLLYKRAPNLKDIDKIRQEAEELVKILTSISVKTKPN